MTVVTVNAMSRDAQRGASRMCGGCRPRPWPVTVCAAAFAIRGAEVLPSPLPLGDGFGIGSLEQKIKIEMAEITDFIHLHAVERFSEATMRVQ